MRFVATFLVLSVLCWLPACASSEKEKAKPRSPLPVGLSASPQARQATQEGTREYQSGRYEAAKTAFQQAVAGAPKSAEAHYNFGLALFALGDTDQAREHFLEAANLAPGNKVIWDSPALRPYGEPDPNIAKKKMEYKGRAGQGGIGPGGR